MKLKGALDCLSLTSDDDDGIDKDRNEDNIDCEIGIIADLTASETDSCHNRNDQDEDVDDENENEKSGE